jgi:SEC-C motif-containing protein
MRRTTAVDPASPCPCGLGQPYDRCCGRLHREQATAPTRPRYIRFDPQQRWSRLDILGKTGGGFLDADGTVEFRAHYSEHAHSGVLHEHSRFVRHNGLWAYLGPMPATRLRRDA